ncbi:DUF3574 domain-containing protein [Streptomyces racemochromogenes]|uniref:DUF3574 domain-containing protein n=1 Tax=Streptomyces racemochromogenes TaxID=67353 RepID=A0ABW7PP07_9ACTN
MKWTSDTRGKAAGGVLVALLGAGIPALVGAALHGRAGEPYRETRLYFGTQRPDGGRPVGKAEFTAFLDREVTPDFPEGLTFRDAYGQRRGGGGGIVRETSYEVVLLYPEKEAAERGARVERIRRAYEEQFRQDAVGRSDDELEADL